MPAVAIVSACCLCAGAPPGEATTSAPSISPGSPDLRALDYAFRFASAIVADAKDRARAQEAVVRDYADRGALDEALRRAEEIEGWRRGVILADLAGELARLGRTDEARDLARRAEEVRRAIRDWQNPRIAAHLAQSLALLGEFEESRRIAMDLIAYDGQQYAGRSVSVIASGYAAQGSFEQAMEEMAKLDGTEDLYDSWWRTIGLIAVAHETKLSDAQRLEALREAQRAAEGIAGWKRGEALAGIAEEFVSLGQRKAALEVLQEADRIIGELDDGVPVKAVLLTNLARAWTIVADHDRARALLRQAEPLVPRALDIERPGVWAGLAEVYAMAGQPEQARRLYSVALDTAESLVNARPRALAAVAICRSMSRQDGVLDELSMARLDSLYEGLGEPW
jgi:tetratricopeptide (TPR) repeat protein